MLQRTESSNSMLVAIGHYNCLAGTEICSKITDPTPPSLRNHSELDILGFHHNSHGIGHEVTSRVDQFRTRDVALVVP